MAGDGDAAAAQDATSSAGTNTTTLAAGTHRDRVFVWEGTLPKGSIYLTIASFYREWWMKSKAVMKGDKTKYGEIYTEVEGQKIKAVRAKEEAGTALTADEELIKKHNDNACSYLTYGLKGEPFEIMQACDDPENFYEVKAALDDKYNPVGGDNKYEKAKLERDNITFGTHTLEDPGIMFRKWRLAEKILDDNAKKANKDLADAHVASGATGNAPTLPGKMTNYESVTEMLKRLPTKQVAEYSELEERLREEGLATLTFGELEKKVQDLWNRKLKGDGKQVGEPIDNVGEGKSEAGTEKALTVGTGGYNRKSYGGKSKFGRTNKHYSKSNGHRKKGACYYCGNEGHMKSECRKLKVDQANNCVHPDKCGPKASNSSGRSYLNQSNGKSYLNKPNGSNKSDKSCYTCGNKGHLARDCPNKDSVTGFFVGGVEMIDAAEAKSLCTEGSPIVSFEFVEAPSVPDDDNPFGILSDDDDNNSCISDLTWRDFYHVLN